MASQQKYNKLANAHVLIIGGSTGIGYCVAEACLEQGARVTISSSQPSHVITALEKLRSTYHVQPSHVVGHICDLSTPSTAETNLAALFSSLDDAPLDHIIYTAGNPITVVPLHDITVELMQRAGMVRFFAPMLVAKLGIRRLKPGPASSIVLTAGSVGQKPFPNWSIMAAYAAGLYGMVRNLALDVKPVRVNLVSVGPVMTGLWDPMPEEERQAVWKGLAEKHTTGEMGKLQDVAEAYFYAMRDWNCSGSVIETNPGGLLM